MLSLAMHGENITPTQNTVQTTQSTANTSTHITNITLHIAPLEEQRHNSKSAHFELFPQKVRLRPHLPSGKASHVYFLKQPREGRSVVLLMRLHCQWIFPLS
jgi:hypothetical protein